MPNSFAGVIQIIETFAPEDGIGNIIWNLHQEFQKAGLNSQILAINDPRSGRQKSVNEIVTAIWEAQNARDLVIYHYGAASEILDRYFLSTNQICWLLYYHNITPSHYWKNWSGLAYKKCNLGEKNLLTLGSNATWITGESAYSLESFPPAKLLRPVLPPIGVHRKSIRRNQALPSCPTIIFVGRVAPNKRQDLLLALAFMLKHSGLKFHLRLIGKCNDRYGAYIRFLVRFYQLQNEIRLVANLPEKELQNEYDQADFFVAATEHEGFCMPVADAIASGLQPILRPIPVFQELYGAGQNLAGDMDDWHFVCHAFQFICEQRRQRNQPPEKYRAKPVIEPGNYLTPRDFAKAVRNAFRPPPRKKSNTISREQRGKIEIAEFRKMPFRVRLAFFLNNYVVDTRGWFLLSAIYLRLRRLFG